MTDPRWRIIGDQDEPEVFIPFSPGPRSMELLLDTARRMRGEWTSEELAEMERRRAEDAAKRQADWARNLARHEELVKHSPHPTLTLVLEAHGPHIRLVEGRTFGPECHACPGGFDEDGDIVHPLWPCSTWKMIDRESQ